MEFMPVCWRLVEILFLSRKSKLNSDTKYIGIRDWSKEMNMRKKCQSSEKHRREWKSREAIRRRCIHPMINEFDKLGEDSRVNVRILIIFLGTRGVFPRRSDRYPTYRDVLTGKETLTDWSRFPWQAVVLIVQYYILFVNEDYKLKANPELQNRKNPWSGSYICNCNYTCWDLDQYEEYCYYKIEKDYYYLELAELEYEALEGECDLLGDFPLGEFQKIQKENFRRDQSSKSRHRLPAKFRPRGGRSGKRRFFQED